MLGYFQRLAAEPRYHGNGFIQLPLNAQYRLHFWTPNTTPSASNNATIHNHVWHMESGILMGLLNHTVYDVEEAVNQQHATHHLYEVRNGELTDTGLGVLPRKRDIYTLAVGSRYLFPAGMYHETAAEYAMTVINKVPAAERQLFPNVLATVDAAGGAFDAHADDRFTVDMMWQEIDICLALTDKWGHEKLAQLLEKTQ